MNWPLVLALARIGPLLAVLCFVSVTGCSRNKAIAVLAEKRGNVQRAEASRPKTWDLVAVGVAFALGDALRTAHEASANLELDDGSELQVRQDTVVRFLLRPPESGHQAFDVETGQVLLEAGNNDFVLETSLGTARIEAGSRVGITRTAQGVHFDVTVGKAELETEGHRYAIDAGKAFVISVGGSVAKERAVDGNPSEMGAAKTESSAAPTQAMAGAVSARILGTGVRTKAPNETEFTHVVAGTMPIVVGTTIRVEPGSSVQLQRNDASVSLLGAGSYVVRTEDASVEVLRGSLTTTGPMRIVVPGGVIETTGRGNAMLDTLEKASSRLRVSTGSATITSGQGGTLVFAGEEATLRSDGTTKLDGRSLGYTDLVLNVGETYTVHEPKPPTVVRFLFGSWCPTGAGTVRVSGNADGAFASGQSEVSIPIGTGRHKYALYCRGEQGVEDAPVANGTLTMIRDAGTRSIPMKPPSTLINSDGRTYTITYQNQLPNLTVTWPNAPPSSQYVVHVDSQSKRSQFVSLVPNHTFQSGTLSEGRHTIHFEGGGRFSRRTSVEIVFDNAAPKVSLLTPTESNVEAGGEIMIAGVAQPGWSVQIDGKKVELDARLRFAQKATMPTTERAIAIKVNNPTRGTHVYLRRAASAHD